MYKFGDKSLRKLEGVNSLLVEVAKRSIELSKVDFGISEGVRTLQRQEELYKTGKSKTMKSYHLKGEAFDIFALDEKGNITWEFDYYKQVNDAIQKSAKELGATVTWGGSWNTFKDGPHFQIEI